MVSIYSSYWKKTRSKLLVAVFLTAVLSLATGGLLSATDKVHFISFLKPEYPELARKAGVQGFVNLLLNVKSNGEVTKYKIINAVPEGYFEDAVKSVVYSWVVDLKKTNLLKSSFEQRVVFSLCDDDEKCVNRTDIVNE